MQPLVYHRSNVVIEFPLEIRKLCCKIAARIHNRVRRCKCTRTSDTSEQGAESRSGPRLHLKALSRARAGGVWGASDKSDKVPLKCLLIYSRSESALLEKGEDRQCSSLPNVNVVFSYSEIFINITGFGTRESSGNCLKERLLLNACSLLVSSWSSRLRNNRLKRAWCEYSVGAMESLLFPSLCPFHLLINSFRNIPFSCIKTC